MLIENIIKLDIAQHIASRRIESGSSTFNLISILRSGVVILGSHWKLHLLRHEIRRERKTLSRLNSRELEDIGINRADALQESQRGYSDIPESRMISVNKNRFF